MPATMLSGSAGWDATLSASMICKVVPNGQPLRSRYLRNTNTSPLSKQERSNNACMSVNVWLRVRSQFWLFAHIANMRSASASHSSISSSDLKYCFNTLRSIWLWGRKPVPITFVITVLTAPVANGALRNKSRLRSRNVGKSSNETLSAEPLYAFQVWVWRRSCRAPVKPPSNAIWVLACHRFNPVCGATHEMALSKIVCFGIFISVPLYGNNIAHTNASALVGFDLFYQPFFSFL